MFRSPLSATFSLLSKGAPSIVLNSVSPRIANRALVGVGVNLSPFKVRNMSSYVTEQHGSLYCDNYRLFFKKADDGTPVSPMHDIPL